MNYENKLNEYIKLINLKLKEYYPKEFSLQKDIYSAMSYSLQAKGKRIRPVITLEFCRICGSDINKAFPIACAIEMIHTYSLIHDDLPAMDNDMLRRGIPTNHIIFGEALSILAGDGLLNLAFETIVNFGENAGLSNSQIIDIIKYLAKSSGVNGMIGGQVIDIKSEKSNLDIGTLNKMHLLKTGALFKASAVLGCICANSYEKISFAEQFAENIGLAFQIKDDILDIEGKTEILGKQIFSDKKNDKTTYVKLLDLDGAKQSVLDYTNKAVLALNKFNNNDFLIWLCDILLKRDK